MDFLFPRNKWAAFLLLIGVNAIVAIVAEIKGSTLLWDNFSYFAVPYIAIRYFYVYWPSNRTSGRHNRSFGMFALAIGALGILITVAVAVFHLVDREAMEADLFGSAIFLSVGGLQYWGAMKFPSPSGAQPSIWEIF